MYKFHNVQCHPDIPTLTGWYLEVQPYDFATIMDVHLGVAAMYFGKFGRDPHMTEAQRRIYNPLSLAQSWMASMLNHLKAGAILINMNGGFMPLDDSVIILDTVESENIRWHDRYDEEVITISKWPEAKHWYLSSNKNRVFLPDKHSSYSGAMGEAKLYVPEDRIVSR